MIHHIIVHHPPKLHIHRYRLPQKNEMFAKHPPLMKHWQIVASQAMMPLNLRDSNSSKASMKNASRSLVAILPALLTAGLIWQPGDLQAQQFFRADPRFAPQVAGDPSNQYSAFQDGFNDGMSDAKDGRESHYARRGFRYNAVTERSYASGYARGHAEGWRVYQNVGRQGRFDWGGGFMATQQQGAYQEGFRDGQNDRNAGNSPHAGRHPTTHPGYETWYRQGYADGYNSMERPTRSGRSGVRVPGRNTEAYREGFSDGQNDHKAGNSPHAGRHPTTHPGYEADYHQGYVDGYNSVNLSATTGIRPGGAVIGESVAAYQEGYSDGKLDRQAGHSFHPGRHPTTHPGFEADYQRGYSDGYRKGR